MKNLNRFTKAELINKMKNIQSKIVDDNSSNKSILIKLVEGLIFFKS
jgi:hypothetical protein